MNLEFLVTLIDRQHWLDDLAQPLQDQIKKLYAVLGPSGERLRDFLHGRWLGHPLHATLTDIPLGAWTVALGLDFLETLTRRRAFRQGADAAIALGLGGALGAGLAGLTDWHHLRGHPRRVGIVHFLLNLTVTLLYGGALIARLRQQRRAGRRLAGLGYLLLTISAYLGGHLAYGDKIGATHALTPVRPHRYTPALPLSELAEGERRRVMVEGYPVLLVRHQGVITALGETCPHLGGPLAEGTLHHETVVCPWHGSHFRLEDGEAVQGPAVHPTPLFNVRIHNGQIEVRIDREVTQHGYEP